MTGEVGDAERDTGQDVAPGVALGEVDKRRVPHQPATLVLNAFPLLTTVTLP